MNREEEGMWEAVFESGNLKRAWKQVRANHGAPGVDGMSVEEFSSWAKEHWKEIASLLEQECYRPQPVRRVEIDKPGGGIRLLGIPTVLDRMIQQALAQVLSKQVDGSFHSSSYGFRPGKSAHQAIQQLQADKQSGYVQAVDLDLEKFFDRVNHEVLMRLLRKRITDERVLRLIGKYLRAGVELAAGRIEPTREGVPQGGPLSPLLANILLDELDKELERRGHRFARYADDFIILTRSVRAAGRVYESVWRWLERRLKLKINAAKSRVGGIEEMEFLSFTLRGKRIVASEAAVAEFRHRVKGLSGRSWGVSMQYRIKELNSYVRGWFGYFSIGLKWRSVVEWEKWLRRRLRMCWWKRWRNVRRRVRELMKLGCDEKRAVTAAMSRKSFWRLSRTYATQLGMTKDWLSRQGLVSMGELWSAVHYPQTKTKPRPEPEGVNLWGW
jgi:RNA-directed DNA polymerase